MSASGERWLVHACARVKAFAVIAGAVALTFALLSACTSIFGYSCDTIPPNWGTAILVPASLPGESLQCVVTASRGNSSIEFDLMPDTRICTRVGDTEDEGCTFELDNECRVLDGGVAWCQPDQEFQQWIIRLDATDEAYLGGLDFDLAVSCNGMTIQQSQETFDTQLCEK